MPDTSTGYDGQGRWIREDRPEMLSDRLGYPPERGDEDWQRIKAAREQVSSPTEGASNAS